MELDQDRLITSTLNVEDVDTENVLRPKTMEYYIGQDKLKANLGVYIEAAVSRKETLDHVLLHGSAGLGKTTLAKIIANELGTTFMVTSGPAIERAADLAAIMTNLSPNQVLFIDEIHRINHSVEEILYPAMEDFCLDFIVGKGPSARSVRLPLPKFTLIGATTRIGMLSQPLRDRFGIQAKLEMYTPEQLAVIVANSAKVLQTAITNDGAVEIARRSRGTPRIANRLLKRVRDFAQVRSDGIIGIEVAKYALHTMGIDELGLDAVDKAYLTTLIDKFNGGPSGIDALSSVIGEDTNTIEDVYEPYLLQLGFIVRTPRGRIAQPCAYAHLCRKINEEKFNQLNIFEGQNDNNNNNENK